MSSKILQWVGLVYVVATAPLVFTFISNPIKSAPNNIGLARKSAISANTNETFNKDFSPEAYKYFESAIQKREKGNYRGALADFNRAIAISPNFAGAYGLRASLKDQDLNDPQGALADYDRGIEIDPTDAFPYTSRASLKNRKFNDTQGALTDFNRAIEIKPTYAMWYELRGYLKLKLKNRFGAISDVEQAANMYQQQGDTYLYKSAIESIKTYQRIDINQNF